MRIVLLIDDMHPRSGGPPMVVAGSAAALSRDGHEVTIVTGVQPGDEEAALGSWADAVAANVRFRLVPPTKPSALWVGRPDPALREEIAKADAVHIHAVWSPMAIVAARVARAAGVPYFVSTHGVFDHRAMRRVAQKWVKKRIAFALFGMRRLLEQSAGVIFGSPSEAENSWIPSRRMQILYIPNGANPELGTQPPTAGQLNQLREAAPKSVAWGQTLLCRSRIHPEKGIDLLVAAFDEIAEDHPDVGLLITGLRQDPKYEEAIQAQIVSSPARDRIQLTTELTGAASRFVYRASDIVVMPSLSEGFSMALIEALAFGRPMLITRYCHVPEVSSAAAGLVVESTVAELANGLRTRLSQSDVERQAMGVAARALFEKSYVWSRVATLLGAAYGQAAATAAAIPR